MTAPAPPKRLNRAALIAMSAFAGVLIATPYVVYKRMHAQPAPINMGELPPWELTSHRGKPFGTKQLAGKPYVTSFFFTSCPSTCPKIMGAMAKVQAATKDLQLVSITVDPLTDTPKVLAETMPRYKADATRWTLCTGTEDQVQDVIVGGFKTFVGKKVAKSADVYDIAHGARLVLVDGNGEVRGHFGTDQAGLDELIATYKRL